MNMHPTVHSLANGLTCYFDDESGLYVVADDRLRTEVARVEGIREAVDFANSYKPA